MAEINDHILTHQERHQQFIESGWLNPISIATVSSHWLYNGESRLDGGYYANDAITALHIVKDSGFPMQLLDQLTEPPFYPNRFKRIYAKSQKAGTPFLTASEMLQFRPTSEAFLANNTRAVNVCQVQPNWILVTRSGTVGRCVIVNKRLSHFAITDDAIRVKPREIPGGYLYAFLSSKIGQALISKDQYGSAINHLEPHHLAKVPVPLLPEEAQMEIHTAIMQAYTLRDEANQMLDEADDLLHERLGLVHFDEDFVKYISASNTSQSITRLYIPHPRAFSIKASELNDRLDVSYHIPVVRTVTELLHKGKYLPVPVHEIAENIYLPPRFKRIYVTAQYGVPFLRPSHLPQMRHYDLGYISNLTKVLDLLALKSGDVLITSDGTVGKIGLVTSRITGWAGSNNIARITCKNSDSEFTNGYLAAFLNTPYGYHQLVREIYGGVIDHIEESQIGSVLIPNPPSHVQMEIGKQVIEAFEKKDEARVIEENAIRKIEALLLHKEETHN